MSNRKTQLTLVGERNVAKFREAVLLPPIRQGFRSCLRCDNQFYSTCLASNRMCDGCKVLGATYESQGFAVHDEVVSHSG